MNIDEINQQAQASFEKGDFYEAIRLYSSAILLQPNDISFYNNRSISFLKLNDYKSALNDINDAIKMSSKCSYLYNTKSSILLKSGEASLALDCINTAIDIENTVENLTTKLVILREMQEYNPALKLIDEIKKLLSDFNLDIEIYNGILLFQTKKYEAAKKIFLNILDMHPKDNISKLYIKKINNMN